MKIKDEFAFKMANNLVNAITRGATPFKRPLEVDVNTERKRPDFHFCFPNGKHYVIEVERWISPRLRTLEDYLYKHLNTLNVPNGTFAVFIPYNLLNNGRFSNVQIENLTSDITKSLTSNIGQKRYALSIGELVKIRDSGRKIVPVICAREFPPYLDEDDNDVKILYKILMNFLNKSEEKFFHYRHPHILLLDISQNPFDREYHADVSSEGLGIIQRWIKQRLKPSTRIDYVCIHQYRVWSSCDGMRTRMLTGHKYVDLPSPYVNQVWCKSGLPNIFNTFTF